LRFRELIKKVKELPTDSVRVDDASYFEAVFVSTGIKQLSAVLTEAFGAPAFPSTKKIPPEIQPTIDYYGGVSYGQTLYYSVEEGATLLVLLWPWRDGTHTTVKIGKA
jgi:hypothetical protein